jgi:hypothetical protein
MSEVRCPTCQQPFDPNQTPAMPFCSERCRLIDLGRWLDERFAVPVRPTSPGESPLTPAPDVPQAD